MGFSGLTFFPKGVWWVCACCDARSLVEKFLGLLSLSMLLLSIITALVFDLTSIFTATMTNHKRCCQFCYPGYRTAPAAKGGNVEGGDDPKPKLIIKLADGKERTIQYIAATTYWGPDGKPMTAQQFFKRLFGDLSGMIATEDELRWRWSNPENREHFSALLELSGSDADKLSDIRRLIAPPEQRSV